jgi:hypothetical protein
VLNLAVGHHRYRECLAAQMHVLAIGSHRLRIVSVQMATTAQIAVWEADQDYSQIALLTGITHLSILGRCHQRIALAAQKSVARTDSAYANASLTFWAALAFAAAELN